MVCLTFIAWAEKSANESRVLAEAGPFPETLTYIVQRQQCFYIYVYTLRSKPEGECGLLLIHTRENIAIHFEAESKETKIWTRVKLGTWPRRARDTVNTKSTLGVTPCEREDVTSTPSETVVDRMLFDVHQPRHIQADRRRIEGSGDEFKSPLWRNRKTESTKESKTAAAGPVNWAKESHPLGIKFPGELSDGDNKERFSRKRNITWTIVVMTG